MFCWQARLGGLLSGSLGQKDGLDVGQDTSLGDSDTAHQTVQLLVVADSQLEMAGVDPALLVVSCGVACQLQHLGRQVLHDGSQVHGGTCSNTAGVIATAKETVDSADGELQTGAAGTSPCLASRFGSLSTT